MTPRTHARAAALPRTRHRASANGAGAVPPKRRGAVATPQPKPRHDDTGRWPELKLELVRKYASAWSHVSSRQPGLAHYYIDGFGGPGVCVSKRIAEFVPGSPLNALLVSPPFRHHFLIDLDGSHVQALRALVGDRDHATLVHGDLSSILLQQVLPRVRPEDYRRALCLLDPCGLRLDWRVIETAGRLGTVDLFLHLPLVGANGAALWTTSGHLTADDAEGMTRFWGDDSWRELAHGPAALNGSARGRTPTETPHAAVARAFGRRLKEVARFANVREPLALRDGDGAVAHYLFLAARNDTANHIVEDIFASAPA